MCTTTPDNRCDKEQTFSSTSDNEKQASYLIFFLDKRRLLNTLSLYFTPYDYDSGHYFIVTL